MIIDQQTNWLFLADCLPVEQPKFYKQFTKVLKECNIPIQFLPYTKDIWAVDFMPVQINKEKFIQFTYNPDYLQSKRYWNTISDVDRICKAIKLLTDKSKIVLDGGNVVRGAEKVIMCDKVFYENKFIAEKDLIKQLYETLQVEKIIFIPWDKEDFTGHADGMVRFIDDNTVLINHYTQEDHSYQRDLRMALHNAGIGWVDLPYNPSIAIKKDSAEGLYLNFLQMQQAVIMPTFNKKDDESAYKILEQVFKGQRVLTIESSELANEGGVLNCITWNILE